MMSRSEQAAERLSGSQDLILENPEEAEAAICRVGWLENSVGSGILAHSGFQHVDSLLKKEKKSWGVEHRLKKSAEGWEEKGVLHRRRYCRAV